MKRTAWMLGTRLALVGYAVLFAATLFIAAAHSSLAQAPAAAPDFGALGFPTVVGSVSYVPGTAATITGSDGFSATIPADFYKNPAKIELLTGPAGSFTSEALGNTVLAPFALRVTDTTSGQIVASGFGSPWTFAYTGPQISGQSIVMNVTAATPPAVTVNGTAPTISGQTLTHPFTSASVGWLVANPAASAGPASVPASAAPPAPPVAAAPPAVPPVAAAPPPSAPIAAAPPPPPAVAAASSAPKVQAPAGTAQVQAPAPVKAQAPAAAPRPAAASAPAATLPSTGTGGLLQQPAPLQVPITLGVVALGLLMLAAGAIASRGRRPA